MNFSRNRGPALTVGERTTVRGGESMRRDSAKKTSAAPRKMAFLGWKTSDQEEVERRRLRAQSEPFSFENLEPAIPVFGTFKVKSENGRSDRIAHIVELRSFQKSHNSCSCPDYQVNGLGTCKHIEALLAKLAGEHGRGVWN